MQIRLAIIVVFTLLTNAFAPVSGQDAGPSTEAEIQELIQQLGDDNYRVRVRANEKLQKLGLAAFDELRKATDHDDQEIVNAARYLLSSLLVSWSNDSDPEPVREALKEYGANDDRVRASKIERLATLRQRMGLEALARLVRFEPDIRLSRKAALLLMQQPISDQAPVRNHRSRQILGVIQKSTRQSARWLRVYAQDLASNTYSVDEWQEVLATQRRELDAGTSKDTSRSSVLELVRICSARAKQLGNEKESSRIALSNIDLVAPTTRDLVEACDWAVDNRMYDFVLTLRNKHGRMFSNHPILLYGVAQAELLVGNKDEARKIAAQALGVNAFPEDEEARQKLSKNAIEEKAEAHLLVAQELSQRGLFEWAESEYRHIIAGVELTSGVSVNARALLADMLGELLRHDAVIEVLQPVVDRYKKDAVFKRQLDMSRISMHYLESLAYFHRGLKAQKDGDIQDAKDSMMRAYRRYPTNIDILIAMYRLKSDKKWSDDIRRDLSTRVRAIESELRSTEMIYRQRGQRADFASALSRVLNEYAWLVSNTEGDYQRALRESLRSLELTPDDAAKLDTAARCYLSLDQLENALEMQTRAIELMPHSPPMIRQLNEINQRIAQSNKKS